MDGVEEVIRIRIIKFDKLGRAHWSGMYGQPHTGAWAFPIPDLEVGDELVVALEWKLTAWVPNRIVNTGGRSIVQIERPALDDEEMWVPGFENSDEPIAIGDLFIENITFSADDGSGRTSKRRPCVVIAITDSETRLLPIHSTGGALHRSGRGMKLLDWKLARLSKNSVVNPDVQRHSIDRPLKPSRRVGRLTERDLNRVLGNWNARKS
jgi:hypothetical protein